MILDAALAYADLGYRVFPCSGKVPATGGNWKELATGDASDLCRIWRKEHNIGIVVPVGVVVIDLDVGKGKDGRRELKAMAPAGWSYAGALCVTGSVWKHLWFQGSPLLGLGNGRGSLPPGIDVRGGGLGYVIAPPSVHPDTGKRYQWQEPLVTPPELPELPDWMTTPILTPKRTERPRAASTFADTTGRPAARAYLDAALESACERIRQAPDGEQNDTINTEAFSIGTLLGHGLDENHVYDELLAASIEGGHPAARADRTIQSGLRSGAQSPRQLPDSARERGDHAQGTGRNRSKSNTRGRRDTGSGKAARLGQGERPEAPHRRQGAESGAQGGPEGTVRPAGGAAAAQGAQGGQARRNRSLSGDNPGAAAAPDIGGHESSNATLGHTAASPAAAQSRARYSDLDNASRLIADHGHELLYCEHLGGWHHWDGARWARSQNHAQQRPAWHVAERIVAEASDRLDWAKDSGDEALLKLAKADYRAARGCQAARAVASMLQLARSQDPIATHHDTVDGNPWFLNAPNGTLDLTADGPQAVRPHSQGDRITMVTGAPFERKAQAPEFDAFMAEILPDPEIRAYVQRWAGYAMTGVIAEHVLPVWYGLGGNGKSALMKILDGVMGDYAGTIPAELLAPTGKGDQHPTGRAKLRGLRLALASESDAAATLAVATVKALTGGDMVVARFMRQDFFEFDPTHKLALMTNHKPRVRDQSTAIWRRVALVPFMVEIPEARQDEKLPGRIIANEGAGVLAWMYRGCIEWQLAGLQAPRAILAATAAYRDDQDYLGPFFDECIDLGPELATLGKRLHDAYRGWCEDEDLRAVKAKTFYQLLEERGIRRGTKTAQGVSFNGLAVRPPSARGAARSMELVV